MLARFVKLYIVGVITAAALLLDTAGSKSPAWALVVLAVIGPIFPVTISHLITKNRQKKQDAKIDHMQDLVLGGYRKLLDDLSSSLTENIRMKEERGIKVTKAEREKAEHPGEEPLP